MPRPAILDISGAVGFSFIKVEGAIPDTGDSWNSCVGSQNFENGHVVPVVDGCKRLLSSS